MNKVNTSKMNRSFTSAILMLMCALLVNASVIAQNRGASKSSKEKKMSSKETEREAKEYEKKIKKGYDPKKNAAAQKGETVVRPMKYYGESPSLEELAKLKKNQEALEDGNGKIEDSDREPVLEDTSEQKTLDAPDAEVQTETNAPSAASLQTSFESNGTGLTGFSLTSAPPDTTMAVGPTHIVHWVNTQYAIFDKAGKLLLGPVNGNTLFTGMGNGCETTNRGDPFLQYDRRADRWFLSQFAFGSQSSIATAPFLQCIAVSTTGDPTGTYYRYTIDFSNSGFNDYGKIGVWNDAYYTSYNIARYNTATPPSLDDVGVALCASDRTKMLAGDPNATTLCAPTAFYAGGSAFLPADLEGDLPTDPTRGGVFVRYSGTEQLRMVRLKPDFTALTITIGDGYGGASDSFISFPVGATTLPCGGDVLDGCIAQPETTTKLSAIGDRLMYRLVYRNRGGVDSLMVNQSVDPDGAGTRSAAVRWYEIRNPLANPSDPITGRRPYLYQNSTYDPGATGDRWMGLMGMNKFGDIMIGYSIADAPNFLKPSINVAGRGQLDALNKLQAESRALTGTGSQTNNLTRWGDYSTIQTDPADEESFWFTTEYLSANGSNNWRTRVVSYKFPSTTALGGNFNVPTSWSNGVPNATVSGTIPTGVTITVSNSTTAGNLLIENGGNLVINADLDVSGSLTLGSTIVNTGANTLGLGCNATVSNVTATTYVIGNIRKDFCRTQDFVYPTGTANGFSPVEVNVTALPVNPSSLQVKAVQGNRPGIDPAQSVQRYWTLNKTGDLTADLIFNYLQTDVVGSEANYKLYRFDNGAATAVTPFTLDTAANTVLATEISTFSDWAIGNLAPTAAGVSVSGRVATANGRGIRNVSVSLTDAAGNTRTTATTTFGYYRFTNVAAGQTYIISASAQRFTFDQTTRVLNLNGDNENVNFIVSGLKSFDH